MKLLELFAGTRSVGKIAEEMGWAVFSSDIREEFGTDYTADILEFDVSKVPFRPDVIWASPPCTSFSMMAISRHWTIDNKPKTETARIGLATVKKTMEIIEHFQPDFFFIENPRAKLRTFSVMQGMRRQTVTYCQYGFRYQKPTDIWTNSTSWNPRPVCSPGSPCHVSAPRGSRSGVQSSMTSEERSTIPPDLCREILESCLVPGNVLFR